jgi:hypothetical protein
LALILEFERGGEGVSGPSWKNDGKRKEAGQSNGLFECELWTRSGYRSGEF